MKTTLTPNSIKYLKFLANLANNVLLLEGKTQRVVSSGTQMFLEAELEDELPTPFAVWDMKQLLNIIAALDTPELDFSTPNQLIITDKSGFSLTYRESEKELIKTVLPEKAFDEEGKVKLFYQDAKFSCTLDESVLEKMSVLTTTAGLTHIALTDDQEKLWLESFVKGNDASNKVRVPIGNTLGENFSYMFAQEYIMNLVKGSYQVEIISTGPNKGFGRFLSKNFPIKYVIATDLPKKA